MKINQITLAIDSASDIPAISLLCEKAEIATWRFETGKISGELLPKIDELLRSEDIPKSAIRLIAVSKGPGSLTGIRIGISSAMGLANALNIPSKGVSVLDALAFGDSSGELLAVFKSGKATFYYQNFSNGRGGEIGVANVNILAELFRTNRTRISANFQIDEFEEFDCDELNFQYHENLAHSIGIVARESETSDLSPLYIQSQSFRKINE